MSTERHDEVAHVPEGLPGGLIMRLLVGAVALSVALCFVAYVLLREREAELHSGRFEERTMGAPTEVSDVRQGLFRRAAPPPSLAAAQRTRLEQYGWVDRQARIARIPIAQAIDVVARATQGGAP